MTVIGEAFVAVRPDTQGFGADAERGVLSSVGSIAKKAATIIGGAFVATKGLDFLKSSVAEARESNKVAAQTAAVIKSTGGAARVTAKDVDRLTSAISRKTGIDDEAIAKASNMLLTFTNLRNEAGKNNDIFNQATKIATDMGAAFGTDASASAIQLGKALNDPVKGITALTRVGVTFDAQQKKRIEQFAKEGKTVEAQKIILAELNKEFGGSAEAQATASDKFKVTIGNLKEQLGGVLVPIIDRVATVLAEHLPGAIDATGRAFGRVRDFIAPFVEQALMFWNTLRSGFTEDEGTPVERFALIVREKLLPVIRRVVTFMREHWKPVLIGLGIAFAALTAPITTAVVAFGVLYARSQKVRDIVHTVVAALRSFVEFVKRDVVPVVLRIADVIATGFGNIAESVSKRLGPLIEAVRHIMKAVTVVIAVALAPIILVWKMWGDQIQAVVKIAFGTIKTVVEQALRVIGDVIDFVLAIINGDWGKAWHALSDIPKAVFEAIKAVVSGGISAVWEIIKSLPSKFADLAGLLAGVGKSAGEAFLGALGKAISGAAEFTKDIGKSVLNAIIGFVNKQVIGKINSALDIKIKGPDWLPDIHRNPPDVPDILKLARGGIARSTPGGLLANIAEAGRNELVMPLPDGLLSGLTALARLASSGQLNGGVNVTLVAPPERNAGRELIDELRAVQFLGIATPPRWVGSLT